MKKSVYLFIAMACVAGLVAGCSRKASVPNTPDAAALRLTQSVANDRPEDAFYALPASYQADINAVVGEAAKRMDAELWNGVANVLRRIVRILDTKGDLILETQYLAQSGEKELLRKNWDRFVKTMTILLESDFADIEALRGGDVGKMLADSGGRIMVELKALEGVEDDVAEALDTAKRMGSAIAVLVSQDGETAVVRITIEGEEPEEMVMTRVEGCWIPKEFADGFAQGIADMRNSIQSIDFTSEQGKQMKSTILTQVATIDTLLAQAEAAESVGQMNGVINGIVMGVMGAVMGTMMGM